ncbi:ABC transporter ATP-binding protein [Guptibacillus hwajinpoensis]|uniref:ABC transporter ATP-binding protein n=1 Tax=Guptibacillus hwajinpoensis TaxID=208199 RepID=UPI001883ADEB|nr:dipeptide ABC transporter ATP-binding protein [Pseudalkalibacillus hwajinpoensis]MBF0706973.1 dipeptide ABC transporter ATP-binding protein [Pseudalkalibacillus hwajinpoensis]WLR58395.1 dipeptide ABC transporter ATP-binding protein [Pseudalkalibacillus hwajinpoensis]
MQEALLEVKQLKKHFPIQGGVLKQQVGTVKAVDGVTFTLHKGETFGLVGESGCGKSTTGRMLMRLLEPSEGEVLFDGKEMTSLNKKDLRHLRKDIQMVFQDPFASLNPRHTVEKIIEEPLIVHQLGNKAERKKRVRELLEIVGLSAYHAKRYPHQFSGGQRQRIGIARALAVNPKLIIADEPVSALDVSIQAQVLNLLEDLQKELGLTYLFIAHDLGVVRHISDRVGVMYLGRIVEMADSEKLYLDSKHPYTQALLSAVPVPDPEYGKDRIILTGDVPSPSNPPSGCPFHTRCPKAMDVCSSVVPEFREIEPGHYTACHLYEEDHV